MGITLTQDEIDSLARSIMHSTKSLRFTNLDNKRAVAKACKVLGIRTFSRTAHGSLLDPRATVEGRMLPDKGLANDYRHFTPKLYILENLDGGW